MDQLDEDGVGGAIARSSASMAAVLADAVDAFGRLGAFMTDVFNAMQELYNAVHSAYLEAGAPYGDTSDGMQRWVRERGEAERLRAEADQIIARHDLLAELRRKRKE